MRFQKLFDYIFTIITIFSSDSVVLKKILLFEILQVFRQIIHKAYLYASL